MPSPACPPRSPSRRRARTSACALATLTVLLLACGESSPPPAQAGNTAQRSLGNIVDVAQVAGQFSTLLAAAEAAGLTETLRGEGPFTVFAPTDGAFSELPEGTVESLLADPQALAQVLLYHVVPGTLKVADLRGLSEVETAQGGRLTLAVTPQGLTINGEYLLTSDISASNGIIHVITAVLTP